MNNESFDDLIHEGKDIEAMRYLAKEYYANGKMGYTRKLLLERVADKVESLQAQLAEKDKFFQEWCSGEDQYQQTVSMLDCARIRITELESQLTESQRRKKAAVECINKMCLKRGDFDDCKQHKDCPISEWLRYGG